jgi:hypothetical protein
VSSNLENRYRRLLRVALPGWYRAEREEEMVGLLLADRTDELDLEHGWPGWGEAGATVALGVRTRFAASGAPARAVAVGDVVRLVALIGALVQGAYATQGLMSLVPIRLAESGALVSLLRPVEVVGLVSDVALLVASLAVVTGFRRVAKVLFAALCVLYLVGLVREVGPTVVMALAWHLPLWLTTVALFAGFHRDVRTPPPGGWRWALAVAVPGAAAVMAVSMAVHPYAFYAVATIGIVPVAVVVAGVAHLVRRGGPVGALGLGVWIAAILPVEVVYVTDSGGEEIYAQLAAVMVVVAGALLVVGLRGLRRPARSITP